MSRFIIQGLERKIELKARTEEEAIKKASKKLKQNNVKIIWQGMF